jgi:hypothetical protein
MRWKAHRRLCAPPPTRPPPVSAARRSGALSGAAAPRAPNPLLRWPWAEVREAPEALAGDTDAGTPVQLGYVNSRDRC